ncbi:MAG: Serine--tRNA ligase [Microgenomates group bacterium ADurb.Bin219]|nr:MAG: Serine--tRNA ligase [Microgenomates group bacterium ADurb.Bin219]
MIDIKKIRENPEYFKEAIADKKGDPNLVEEVLKNDKEKKEILLKVENLRAERNKLGKEDIGKGKELKIELKKFEDELEKIEEKLKEILWNLPNPAHPDVPVAKDSSGNKVLRKWGEIPQFGFAPKDHLEIGEYLDLIDVKTAGIVTGSRFGYLKNEAVLLEFALVQLVFKTLTDGSILETIADKVEKGYSTKPFVPVVPPQLIKAEVMDKMARLYPKEERYFFEKDNLSFIGSAEHTLGPMHMDEVIPEKELPFRYVGFSTSFRREAGSYGQDTKGIIRVHQFDKLEMESFSIPENSLKEQDFIVGIQEYLVRALKIPYQVVAISTGDMGGPDYRQIDIECWLPGQNKYRETHTSDLMTDYQSRRLNTRVKRNSGQVEFVHMNDATAFAIGRTIVAILENYQQGDGSVIIPEVLRPYLGKDKISPRK